MDIRVGLGYDVHQFAAERKLYLGGIEIPGSQGLKGHSDADVLLHAITDALLGALALGDIGTHFPDTDDAYKDADSKILLEKSYQFVRREGYELVNLDATIIAEKPKLQPYVDGIRKSIADVLGCNVNTISIKATTSEKMGFVGREEGVAVHAIVLVKKR